jgi:hypothetical protein
MTEGFISSSSYKMLQVCVFFAVISNEVLSLIRGLLQKSWKLIFLGKYVNSEESSKYTYERA